MLEQPLCDAAKLHVKMKGNHLALDCCPIGIGFPVQILIAVPATQRFHCRHPKMVSVRAQDVDCLAEAKLDSKSISVEQDDFQRLEGQVGREKKDRASDGMMYDHEPDQVPDRAPEQIDAPILDGHVVFPVHGAGRRNKGAQLPSQILETNLLAVDPWPAAAP